MINKRKNIPEGMRDMIYEENINEKMLAERVLSLYKKRGYGSVATPTLEYFDVFNFDSQTIDEVAMFKLTDKSGRLVVLRPDNTTPMARIAATRLKNAPRPLKICYNQPVFRTGRDYSGKRCEFLQTGIEIIGAGSRADLEAIVMALRTLKEIGDFCGVASFKLELGSALFCKALIDSFELTEEQKDAVTAYISAKNSSSLDFIFGEDDSKKSLMDTVRAIPRLYGEGEVISKARQLSSGVADAERALDFLEEIYKTLEDNGFSENICIDLATAGDMDYYTGVVFRGYIDGIGEAILAGGRYDNLLSNFELCENATGFGVNLSLVADKFKNGTGVNEKCVLVHYDMPKNLKKALDYVENSDVPCVISTFESVEKAMESAKSGDYCKMILIDDDGEWEVELS